MRAKLQCIVVDALDKASTIIYIIIVTYSVQRLGNSGPIQMLIFYSEQTMFVKEKQFQSLSGLHHTIFE